MHEIVGSSRYVRHLVEEINKSLELLRQSTLQQAAVTASMNQRLNEQLTKLSLINFSIDIPRIYTALTIDTSSLLRALDISSEIATLMQSVQETYTQQIVEMTHSLDAVARRFTADLAAFRLAFQNIVSSELVSNLIKLSEENADAAEAFREAGWPIAPSMPKQLRDRVVELHKQGKTRYASQAILGYYRRAHHHNLVSAVESWQEHPLFAPRMRVIRSALQAHCNGSYTLSVPTLLPQIEGVLNDYVSTNNLGAKFGKIKQVYEAVIGDPGEYGLSTWAIANTLLHQLRSSTYAYTSFESELAKSIRARETTRHTVLHGVAIDYDKPSNSLRQFLVLDALTALKDVH